MDIGKGDFFDMDAAWFAVAHRLGPNGNIRALLPPPEAQALLRVFEQIDEMKAAHRAILDDNPKAGA